LTFGRHAYFARHHAHRICKFIVAECKHGGSIPKGSVERFKALTQNGVQACKRQSRNFAGLFFQANHSNKLNILTKALSVGRRVEDGKVSSSRRSCENHELLVDTHFQGKINTVNRYPETNPRILKLSLYGITKELAITR
jgi:hypothetical protein